MTVRTKAAILTSVTLLIFYSINKFKKAVSSD
jgi:hypothetical protein